MKSMLERILWGAGLLLCATHVIAGEAKVAGAWVRATAPGQDTAAVSLRITASEDARLVAASSPAAKRVEIHVMQHENGMMMMREVDSLALPANQDVVLGQGSHLMLTGLKQPLKAGSKIRLSLTVEYADKHREVVTVSAIVRPLTAGHDMPDDMHDHDQEGHHM